MNEFKMSEVLKRNTRSISGRKRVPSSLIWKSAVNAIKTQYKVEKIDTQPQQKNSFWVSEDKSAHNEGNFWGKCISKTVKTPKTTEPQITVDTVSQYISDEIGENRIPPVPENYPCYLDVADPFFPITATNETVCPIPAPVPFFNSFEIDTPNDTSLRYIPPPVACTRPYSSYQMHSQENMHFSGIDEAPPYTIDSDEYSSSDSLEMPGSPSFYEEVTNAVNRLSFDCNNNQDFNAISNSSKLPSSPSFYQNVSKAVKNLRKASDTLLMPISTSLLQRISEDVKNEGDFFSYPDILVEASQIQIINHNSSRTDSEGYWSTNETSLELSNNDDSILLSVSSPEHHKRLNNSDCDSSETQETMPKDKEMSINLSQSDATTSQSFKSLQDKNFCNNAGCESSEAQSKNKSYDLDSSGCKSCEAQEAMLEIKEKSVCQRLPNYMKIDIVNFKSDFGFIDSHCHLDFLFKRQKYEGTHSEYQILHKDTYPKSFNGCIAVFCDPLTFPKVQYLDKQLSSENVWGSFGCHPHYSKTYSDVLESHLISALSHPKVRALGEIGLDYSNRNNCSKKVQHEVFRRQLKIALSKDLPLVIHCRDANEDAMSIMKEIVPSDYLIHFHCFTDGWDWAEKWLDSFPNSFIGITNLVTFRSALPTHDVVKRIPLDRLLLETDAPYFIPRLISKKPRCSHPGMAIHVAAQIAILRDCDLEEVLHWTRKNSKKMYGV